MLDGSRLLKFKTGSKNGRAGVRLCPTDGYIMNIESIEEMGLFRVRGENQMDAVDCSGKIEHFQFIALPHLV